MDQLNQSYKLPDKEKWTGRATSVKGEHWYQQISLQDIEQLDEGKIDIALVGYACDEGVRRNQGRVGAIEGPDSIRGRLGKLAFHHQKSVADVGDVVCVDGDMESAQEVLSQLTEKLLRRNAFPIVMGGGHDVAYGHFNGIKRASPDKKIGILNFDAHFDLRPVVGQPSSGTPFYQILTENDEMDYMVVGIHPSSNTNALFDFAREKNVKFWPIEQCLWMTAIEIEDGLKDLIRNNDLIYVSIDLDGFSSAYAPGVSAPSPIGLDPRFVLKALEVLLESEKVVSLDVAELNPSLDQDQQTANLAAKLIDFVTGVRK